MELWDAAQARLASQKKQYAKHARKEQEAQYMLKGLVGIFLVTGLIILVLVILEKATKGKQEE